MGAANYMRKLLIKIKSHIDMNTLIVGDLNTPFSNREIIEAENQ